MNGHRGLTVGLLLMQATNGCNLRCTYCYLAGKSSRRVMSPATVAATVTRLRDESLLGPEIRILWHAGEPALAGLEFFHQAFSVVNRALAETTRVIHHVQTNATLIDQRWADFFAAHHVKVGVSLDGPEHIHDAQRRYPDGSGAHAGAMKGVSNIMQAGVAPGVICVVTSRSLDYAQQIHDFFCSSGLQFISFNAEEVDGIHRCSSLSSSPGWQQGYERFLTTFLLRSRECRSSLKVREFTRVEQWLRDRQARACGAAIPLHHLTVTVNGDFSTFSPELINAHHCGYEDFILGNVHEQPIRSVLVHPKLRRIWAQIREGLERCKAECSLFSLCGGGEPSNKLFENGTCSSTRTTACEAGIRIPYRVVLGSGSRPPLGGRMPV